MTIRHLAPLALTAPLLIACLAPAADSARLQPATPLSDVQDFVFLGESRPVLVRLHVRLDGKPLQAAWDDFMKYLFAYLDVNGDGVLSKEEAERAPSVDQLLGGALGGNLGGGGRGGRGAAPTGPTMNDLDADGDGKVTLAELSAYYRKMGFVPFQFQLDPPPATPLGAVTAFLGGPGPEPSVEDVSKAIFELIDSNKDGKLTKEKLAAAESLLLKLDENEDELVSVRELVPEMGANLGQLAGMFALGRPGKANAATSSPNLVPILTPGVVPADLVKRMQERYGSADKKLGRKELGLDELTFRLLDGNGDGVLDERELGGFVKRTPDLELMIRLGKKETTESCVEVATGKVRAALAGKMRMQDSQAMLNLDRTRAEILGNDEERPDRIGGFLREQTLGQFRQADTNGDGFLDADEAGNSRQFRSLFKVIDRTGTGKVTEKELIAYLDHLQEMQRRVASACVTLDVSDQSRGLFDLLDNNRDGKLSVRELRQAPKLLDQLDRERKGFITRDEVPRTYRLEVRRGPMTRGGLGGAAAFFESYLSPSYQAVAERTGRGPLWFRKMDRNRDGDVSRKEFLFGEELFRKIDADGDGLISVEEAERYDLMMRKQK